MKKMNQQPSSLFVNKFHEKFFFFQADFDPFLSKNGFSVGVDRKFFLADEFRAFAGQRVDAREMGVKTEERGGQKQQEDQFGKSGHCYDIQGLVFAVCFWAEAKSATLKGQVHGGCKIDV